MSIKNEEKILRELDDLKWADGQFICVRCGNKNYNKGEEPYSRRCSNSKCKRDVTLKKYTAFEGLRFPIEKAYGILETIVSRASLGPHEKVIKVRSGWGVKDFDNDFLKEDKLAGGKTELISLLEYKKRAESTKTGADVLNEKLQQLTSAYQPSIGRLAKTFELEENTVIKFLDKINNRILSTSEYHPKDSLVRILDYLQDGGKRTLIHMLGMAMVPLVNEWKFGYYLVSKKEIYGIRRKSKHDDSWAVFRMDGTKKDFFISWDYKEEISYGSDEWYQLFGENVLVKK